MSKRFSAKREAANLLIGALDSIGFEIIESIQQDEGWTDEQAMKVEEKAYELSLTFRKRMQKILNK